MQACGCEWRVVLGEMSKPKPINLALPITSTQPLDTSDPAPIWATTNAANGGV